MKIYTKGGDKGSTSLVGGFRVSKTHIRIEAYGTLDELNAHLGLLIALLPIGDTTEMLEHIQHMLFTIGCNLATDLSQNALPIEGEVTEKEVALLEKEIDKMQTELPTQTAFILPGGCKEAALAHVCRTVCRRAERRIITLNDEVAVDPLILQYINRLSDYLVVLSRRLNLNCNTTEKKWQKSCR